MSHRRDMLTRLAITSHAIKQVENRLIEGVHRSDQNLNMSESKKRMVMKGARGESNLKRKY